MNCEFVRIDNLNEIPESIKGKVRVVYLSAYKGWYYYLLDKK